MDTNVGNYTIKLKEIIKEFSLEVVYGPDGYEHMELASQVSLNPPGIYLNRALKALVYIKKELKEFLYSLSSFEFSPLSIYDTNAEEHSCALCSYVLLDKEA